MRQHSKKSALHQLSSVILFLKFLLLIMGAFKRFLLLLLFGWLSSAWAFPQDQPEQQTEAEEISTTEFSDRSSADITENGEDDDMLQDQMDKYTDVPYISGKADCSCGMPVSRIVGGENAEISQYPWTVLLNSVESETYKIPYCGAALINNQYVITASHCVDGMDPRKIEVVLREQNVTMSTEEDKNMHLIIRSMVSGGGGRNSMSVIRIGVDKIIQHPQYSRSTLDNDIALIKLKVRVPLEGFQIAPICLPQEHALFSQGSKGLVAGYGATSESGTPALTLQMAEVRMLSNELCNTPLFHDGKITKNMLCADGNGRGPCAGDTGGPLMIRSSRDSNRQVLAGIASWSTTCDDPTRPSVYTRVPMYESWILSHSHEAAWCKD